MPSTSLTKQPDETVDAYTESATVEKWNSDNLDLGKINQMKQFCSILPNMSRPDITALVD